MVPKSTYSCGLAVQGAREARGGPVAHLFHLVPAKRCLETLGHLSRLFHQESQEHPPALVPGSLKPEQNLMYVTTVQGQRPQHRLTFLTLFKVK